MPAAPQAAQFENNSTSSFFRSGTSPNFFTAPGSAVEQQNQRVLQQEAFLSKQRAQIMAEVEHDLMEMEARTVGRSYRQAFSILSRFNPDSFSLTKAVYLVENAYFDGQLLEGTYLKTLDEKVSLVRQIIKSEGLKVSQNVAVNYGIQKLFAKNSFYTQASQRISIPSFGYDFEDFFGKKDYTKMFVSKALATGKGQCHSLPLLYLILAEQFGATAQLSFAPQHSFIQFRDNSGRLLNFETTNGHLVSNSWLTQSGYITSVALQRKTYINPLSRRELFAYVLGDLMLGYLSKFPYDDFVETVRQRVLQINPTNLTGLMVDVKGKAEIAKQKIMAAGKPKEEDLPKYPDAYKAYSDLRVACERVDATGFQDMPAEAYQRWLQSFEKAKMAASNEAQGKARNTH